MSEAKADEGKLRISLVPMQIVKDIAEVREFGCAKYKDPDNWKKVEKQRYVDALLRHTLAYLDNPNGVDDESGIPHYKHMACNLAFICEMEERNKTGKEADLELALGLKRCGECKYFFEDNIGVGCILPRGVTYKVAKDTLRCDFWQWKGKDEGNNNGDLEKGHPSNE